MNILIFGGTGLIGSALALKLIDKHTVTVVTRNSARSRNKFPQQITLQEWNGEEDILPEIVSKADAIVNLVGEGIANKRWTCERKNILYSSRIQTGIQLTNAISANTKKPEVFIQASGIGYYKPIADIEDEPALTEKAPMGQGTFLGTLAHDWEGSTRSLENMGIRRCCIRTATVLAKHGGALPLLRKSFEYYMGGYPSTGEQPFPFIHLRDEVRAIIHLLEHQHSQGAYNLIAPTPITAEDFSKILGDVLKKPCYMKIPQWVLSMLFGELASELLLQGVHAIPEKLSSEGFVFTYKTATEALQGIIQE